MTKEENAKAYADHITFSVQDAVKEAYIKGYEDGVKSVRVDRTQKIGNCEYVDLGLPSGNLWCVYENGTLLNFYDAVKLGLPSADDFKELKDYCAVEIDHWWTNIVGINSKYIRINCDNDERYAWVAQDESIAKDKLAFSLDLRYYSQPYNKHSGKRLPVLLVKKPS